MVSKIQVETAEPAYVQIARQVRRDIQLGRLAPRQRLPSNPELADQWGVSSKVVQNALATLAADGVLERAPRRGTFVSAKVSQTLIGLLFGPRLADEPAHFYRAAQKRLEAEIRARGWASRTYDYFTNSVGLPHPAETQVYQDFASDAQSCAFKGLVQFALGPKGLIHPSSQQSLPSVSYNPPQNDTDFEMDWTGFARESVRFLAAQGCKRITCLMGTDKRSRTPAFRTEGIFSVARELGLPEPGIEWFVTPERGVPFERAAYEQASRVVRRWRDRSADNGLPEALLVTDDILMRGVTLALIENGLKAPRDLKVLLHACEEVNLWYGMPVARHEIPLRRIAKDMLDLLQRRITGRSLPKLPIKYMGQIKEGEE